MATKTWDGGGADDNWMTAANWDSNVAPVAGDALVFTGTVRRNNTNNFPADTAFASITFPAGATSYFSLQGNRITLNGSINYLTASTSHQVGLPILTTTGLTINGDAYQYVSSMSTMDISGAGSVTITGTGLGFNMTGQFLNTGDIIIDDGCTLYVGAAQTGLVVPEIHLHGTTASLSFMSSTSSTIPSDITGTGVVSVNASDATVVTLTGDNTYSGRTIIARGGISVSSINSVVGGAASSGLGAPATAANGTIYLGGSTRPGTLIYTGTGEVTDRVIHLGGTTGSASINQSGTGLLKLTSGFATADGNKTLTLKGSTAGTGEIAGAIVDSTGTTGVTKEGTGKWTLSGANTYTGATTLTAGELSVTGSTHSSSAVTVNGGTLSGSGTVSGTVTVKSGATVSPGVAGAGTLHTGSTTIESGGVLAVSVDIMSQVLFHPSELTLNSGAVLTVTAVYISAPDDVHTIVGPAIAGVTGTFTGKADESEFTVDGVDLRIDYEADSVTLTDVTVPPAQGKSLLALFD